MIIRGHTLLMAAECTGACLARWALHRASYLWGRARRRAEHLHAWPGGHAPCLVPTNLIRELCVGGMYWDHRRLGREPRQVCGARREARRSGGQLRCGVVLSGDGAHRARSGPRGQALGLAHQATLACAPLHEEAQPCRQGAVVGGSGKGGPERAREGKHLKKEAIRRSSKALKRPSEVMKQLERESTSSSNRWMGC